MRALKLLAKIVAVLALVLVAVVAWHLATAGVASAISGKALLDGRLSEEEIRRFLPDA